MEATVFDMDGQTEGNVTVPDWLFGLEARADLLHRVVRWQRAKAMQGTHKVKTRSETNYSRRKIRPQKGSGGARHGDRNAPIFRKGGVYKGPQPRSHAHDLPKKVRKLGLRHALSAKAAAGELTILKEAALETASTSDLAKRIRGFSWRRALIIDGPRIEENFARAASNLQDLDVLPSHGANVYSILKCDTLVVTKAGLAALEERLK